MVPRVDCGGTHPDRRAALADQPLSESMKVCGVTGLTASEWGPPKALSIAFVHYRHLDHRYIRGMMKQGCHTTARSMSEWTGTERSSLTPDCT